MANSSSRPQRVHIGDSETVSSLLYNQKARWLEVEFTGGAVYRYFDVGPRVYTAFLKAESKGRFVNAHVTQGRYRYERIDSL